MADSRPAAAVDLASKALQLQGCAHFPAVAGKDWRVTAHLGRGTDISPRGQLEVALPCGLRTLGDYGQ